MSLILKGPSDDRIQLPQKSIGIILYEAIRRFDPQQILFVEEEHKINYKQFLKTSIQIANKLKESGVRKNDVITIISQNHWKYLATVLAGFYIGATINLLNHDYTLGELKHFLAICKPVVIFCTNKTLPNICGLKDDSILPSLIINYNISTDTDIVQNFDQWLDNDTSQESFTPIKLDSKESVALILTSSGTTGLPKCVELTHHNVRILMTHASEPLFLDINRNDIILGVLPFFHIFGCALAVTSILIGAKFVIMDKFHPERFLNAIQEHKITKLIVVPPIILFLVKSPLTEKYDLSSVRDILSGAAPLTTQAEAMVKHKLKVKNVRQVYGMTEICGAATITPNKGATKSGSSGVAVTNLSIKVCDCENGKALPANSIGELRFKGDGLMKGYLGNEKETKEAFDEEGFLKSGDLGYYDDEGNFYIVDRLKEMIKYKGFQVSPTELESILIQHPAVKDVAVTGKPDNRAGEVPVAFVVRQPGFKVKEEELLKHIAENLSAFKHLHGGVIFTEEIPKSSSGKIFRQKLKDMLSKN